MVKSSEQKLIRIFAGPNGSGKSSIAESFFLRQKKEFTFINPDNIASGISTNPSHASTFQAGRIMINTIHTKLENGMSVPSP